MALEQEVEVERRMAFDLESSALGMLMQQHQNQLTAMIDLLDEAMNQMIDHDGPAVPAWQEEALNLMGALRRILPAYVFRARLRQQYRETRNSADFLRAAYGGDQELMFAQYPRFYEILATWRVVGRILVLGATAHDTGPETEAATVRLLVAQVLGGFAEARRRASAADALVLLASGDRR